MSFRSKITDFFRINPSVDHYGNALTFDVFGDDSFGIKNVGRKYVRAANETEVVDTIIRYLCGWFSKGVVMEKDAQGKTIENSFIVNKLNNPNAYQSKEEFMSEFLYYLLASGTNYIYPLKGSVGFPERDQLINLCYDNIEEPDKYPSIFDFNTDFIFKYKHDTGISHEETERINFSDVIPFYDSVNVKDGRKFKGNSRLATLKDEIINIRLAVKGKQNKIDLSGIVMVTPQDRSSGDRSMSQGLDKVVTSKDGVTVTQKDLIQSKFNGSGLSKGRSIIVGSHELKATNLTETLKGIDFDKDRIEDIKTIKRKFGIPNELLPVTETGAKYENKVSAELELIQTMIEPIANNLIQSLKEYYNIKNEVCIDYSHLPPYSLVEKRRSEEERQLVEMVSSLYSGFTEPLITRDEGRKILIDKGILK